MRIPDRWTDYRPIGEVIPGTRFIAFKCPLKEELCCSLQKSQWFTPQDIIDQRPRVLLVIDLTNTRRYYDGNVFERANISYKKIFVEGHVIPHEHTVSEFFASVNTFLEEHSDDDALIGVHCTHGVNRTGFFICKYMIDKLGIDPRRAIEDVGRARGYRIERENYLAALRDNNLEVGPGPPERRTFLPRQPLHRPPDVRVADNWADYPRSTYTDYDHSDWRIPPSYSRERNRRHNRYDPLRRDGNNCRRNRNPSFNPTHAYRERQRSSSDGNENWRRPEGFRARERNDSRDRGNR